MKYSCDPDRTQKMRISLWHYWRQFFPLGKVDATRSMLFSDSALAQRNRYKHLNPDEAVFSLVLVGTEEASLKPLGARRDHHAFSHFPAFLEW